VVPASASYPAIRCKPSLRYVSLRSTSLHSGLSASIRQLFSGRISMKLLLCNHKKLLTYFLGSKISDKEIQGWGAALDVSFNWVVVASISF